MAPIVKMHTLGHDFMPPAIHAGGLRYHGMAPSLCGLVRRRPDRSGGGATAGAPSRRPSSSPAPRALCPAPESAHAIRAAIDEALDAKAKGEKRVILFNLSGHGNFDMTAYEAYLAGKLEDYEYPEEAVARAMENLPKVVLPA